MNLVIQKFLKGLTDRITALIGSAIGSTAATFRAAHHAEQQSLLEDLARNYESEGKLDIAKMLRQKATRMELDDPGSDARAVMDNVLAEKSDLPALTKNRANPACGDLPAPTPRRKRRQRSSDVKDDSQE